MSAVSKCVKHTFFFYMSTGLQAEGLIHGMSGAAPAHYRGLLEDDLGVEELLYRYADRAGGERTGKVNPFLSFCLGNL